MSLSVSTAASQAGEQDRRARRQPNTGINVRVKYFQPQGLHLELVPEPNAPHTSGASNYVSISILYSTFSTASNSIATL